MRTYLLTWNPATTPWDDLEEHSQQTASGSPFLTDWSCGTNKSIVRGDRIFLLKQGKEQPKDLMASGWVTSKGVENRKHWDADKAREGKKALYIDVSLERLLNPYIDPLLPVADAEDSPISKKVYWNTPASGINIPDSVTDKVEELWRNHLERNGLLPESVHDEKETEQDDEPDLKVDDEDEPGEIEGEEPEENRLPNKVLRAILQRRGQNEFRQNLLAAYGGKCCITGCNAEPALEAAHIVGYAESKSQDIRNALLLRSDIHTLFDLNLIRINPETMRVVLAENLKKTTFGGLHGLQFRLPTNQTDSPKAALWRRWRKGNTASN